MSGPPWLEGLNANQLQAVKWSPAGSLQILAGPGSGKTRVLTCRLAFVIIKHGLNPEEVVAVTFTNKAAKELKDRLCSLISPSLVSRVTLGTFHGMCVTFLRRHGLKIGLKANWLICDRDQQIKYCKDILKLSNFATQIKESNLAMKPDMLLNFVSKSKSEGLTPQDILKKSHSPYHQLMSGMFGAYQELLTADNCLDFDDLLLEGQRLFQAHPSVISHIKHVFIDEFQDTNSVQYQLMIALAHARAVTVVGDPDQGIYGWRNAQVVNLKKMIQDIPGTSAVFLEENYRSSSAILKASLSVVQQDKERIDKGLFTSHPRVGLPMLRPFNNSLDEAAFIAQEIRRLIAHTGGQLNYDDFSILIRYNALSRNIETSLQAAGIPHRMVGGHKFFDRAEVQDVLAYLRLADNPSYSPAFDRIINIPKRNIGAVTLKAIKTACETHHLSPLEILAQATRGKTFEGLKPSQNHVFAKFLAVICKLQGMAEDGCSAVEILDNLIESIGYMSYLEKRFGPEAAQRMENVEELKAFAVHVARELPSDDTQATLPGRSLTSSPSTAFNSLTSVRADVDRLLSLINSRPSDSSERPNFLRQFLAESTLSTDIDTEGSKDDGSLPKVTISTCHAAKGLEWPVVFVAAVEEGVFPFYLCTEPEQVQEERRLLYVAMTRAKGLLYLSHSAQRMRGAESHSQCVSRFVEKLKVSRTNVLCGDSEFSQSPPHINDQVRSELSAVIGRPVVDRKTIDRAVHTYQETEKTFPLSHDAVAQSSSSFSTLQRVNVGQNRWSATRSPPPLGRFSSAKQTAASQAAGQYAHTQQSQGGFTSAYMHSRGVPTPALGKVNASSVRQPFIPQIPRGNMGNKHLPLASASSHPPRTNRYELDDFKKMSAGFVSDLKRQIPEDEPVALNPTDPQPVTGKIKKSSGNEVKPVISLLETETHRSLISKDVEPMKRRIGIGRPGQTHKKSKP